VLKPVGAEVPFAAAHRCLGGGPDDHRDRLVAHRIIWVHGARASSSRLPVQVARSMLAVIDGASARTMASMEPVTHDVTTQRPDHNVWIGLTYDDATAARAWLTALGFQPGIAVPGAAPGEIHHSEMLWPEGGRVMVSSRGTREHNFQSARGGSMIYVVTQHPDAVYARAVALGAPIDRPLRDETDYVSRGFSIRDPEGNGWSFGTYAG
jgi:uncharacterized glyoxalase superfamily protein PhnB